MNIFLYDCEEKKSVFVEKLQKCFLMAITTNIELERMLYCHYKNPGRN